MKNEKTTDLRKLNSPKKRRSYREILKKVHRRISQKHDTEPNRDEYGRFTITSAQGGLIEVKKMNLKRVVPVLLVVAIGGGFFVFKSFASTGNNTSGKSFIKTPAQLKGGELTTKSNGIKHKSIGIGVTVSTSITKAELLNSSHVCVNYTSPENIAPKISIEYLENNSITKPIHNANIYTEGKAYRCIELNQSAIEAFNSSNTAVATASVKFQNKKFAAHSSSSLSQIYSIYGLASTKTSSIKGKFGFTWTQDNVIIPKSAKADIANIPLYGWGSLWPFEEDAGKSEADSGATVEERIKKSKTAGQEIMITACCAPSSYNTTGKSWDLDNSRVKESAEQKYANRVAELVEKYPEIKYIQVWNEFKGYWGTDSWDAKAYTRFYNKVYAAVKARRKSVLVSGGYVVFTANDSHNNRIYNEVTLDHRGVDALQYWLDNADGFDAISLDAFVHPDEFPKIMTYVRTMRGASGKPLWWSEFYNRPTPSSPFSAAGSPYDVATKIAPAMKSGDIALYWAEKRYVPDSNRSLLDM